MNSFFFRKVEHSDKEWIDGFITEHWGGSFIVAHGCKYIPSELNGFIAYHFSERVGLATYQIQDLKCEVITINCIMENRGIGTHLISLVEEEEALKNNCSTIWLTTTNDNLRAIGFYLKNGYKLLKVHRNAIEEARKLKPEIPLIAENGIPITDEFEFVKKIKS